MNEIQNRHYLCPVISGAARFFMEIPSGLVVIKEYSGILRFSQNGKKMSRLFSAQAA